MLLDGSPRRSRLWWTRMQAPREVQSGVYRAARAWRFDSQLWRAARILAVYSGDGAGAAAALQKLARLRAQLQKVIDDKEGGDES